MEQDDALISLADRIAASAHAGQVRKWTLEPYVEHPRSVAALVRTVPHTPAMVAAALLHDVLEDTTTTADELREQVGDEVTQLVIELTDQIGLERGNRATRKRLEAERLATVSAAAQTVKVADLIDNSRSIVAHDRGFARIYLAEKALLLSLLTKADDGLRVLALQELARARTVLGLQG